MAAQPSSGDPPTLEAMHEAVKNQFGFFLCTWQLEAALTQLRRNNLITLAPTGSGKTLTFWIPLLFNEEGIIIVVTPLVVLGDKNIAELSDVSIPTINLTMESALDDTFKEIESLKYCIIITSPECVLTDWRLLELWKSKKFVRKLCSFVFNEAHCITQWSGEFHPLYAKLRRLQWILPSVVFYAASATLPPHILKRVKETLHMQLDKTWVIWLSNNHPNIHLQVLEMLELVHSYYDILRMLRFDGDPPPPLFMVPPHLAGKLLWFHSGMSQRFWTETIEKLCSHEIWGIFCTDTAGMASGS
ncbi:P-loop containing nucleoside triphosphate hydrolase protein [Lactarius tabidus]